MTDRQGLRPSANDAATDTPRRTELDALRDEVDPDDDARCVDCGVELEDGNYTLICRECADVDD
jgi:hypothetical protein